MSNPSMLDALAEALREEEQVLASRDVVLSINPKSMALTVESPIPPSQFISIARARCIARYRMRSIPGRPEELETFNFWPIGPATEKGMPVTRRTISFAYSGGEMRIRKHGESPNNRTWTDHRDFRLRDDWMIEVYRYLDDWLLIPATQRPTTLDVADGILGALFGRGGPPDPTQGRSPVRPIRDNPQA